MTDSIPTPEVFSNTTYPLIDSFPKRLTYAAFMIAAPIFNFSFIEVMAPLWRSGKFSDYIYMALLPEAAIWFFPLLAYSVISYLLILNDEERYSSYIIVRLGIYTGLILSFQYSLLAALTWDLSPVALVYILFIISPLLLSKLRAWIQNERAFRALIFAALVILILWAILAAILGYNGASPIFFLAVFIPMSAPFWCFFIALQAARWLWKYHESKLTLAHGFGLFAWISAYVFALRFNIVKMYELYTALPTQPPNCYIATAAANGHPAFVRSHEVQLQNGQSMRVNKQLQILKCTELALLAASPRLHKIFRAAYDVTGKSLARRIQNPFLSDMAYLALKPFEWIAVLMLSLVTPAWKNFVSRIYIKQ